MSSNQEIGDVSQRDIDDLQKQIGRNWDFAQLPRLAKMIEKYNSYTPEQRELANSRLKGGVIDYVIDRQHYFYDSIFPSRDLINMNIDIVKNNGRILDFTILFKKFMTGDLGSYVGEASERASSQELSAAQQDALSDSFKQIIGSLFGRGDFLDVNEYQELVNPVKRKMMYRIKEFQIIMDWIQDMGKDYKTKLLKYIKKLEYKDTPEWYKNIETQSRSIYEYLKAQDVETAERPSIFLPSAVWIGGKDLHLGKNETDVDLVSTIPKPVIPLVLEVQKHFEADVFNALIPNYNNKLLIDFRKYMSLKQKNEQLVNNIINEVSNVDDITDAQEKLFKDEYDRQVRDNETLHILDRTKANLIQEKDTDLNTEHSNWKLVEVRKIEGDTPTKKYNNWKKIFVTSDEYSDWVKDQDKEHQDALSSLEQQYEPTKLDIDKLSKEKTFYNADIFDEEDTEGLNYDVIQHLKEQEDTFNELLSKVKDGFTKDEQKKKSDLEATIEALKKKIQDNKDKNFKELDDAMATNKENQQKRIADEAERKIASQKIVDEDSALASLTNYSGCDSKPKQTVPPPKVYKDVNIQDLVQKQNQALFGQGKKMSLAQQLYLLNKAYVRHTGEGKPHGKKNRSKYYGGIDSSAANDSIGDTGYTANDVSFAGTDTKENDDVDMAMGIVGTIGAFAPFPLDVAIGIVTAIVEFFNAEEAARKREEARQLQIEQNRRENTFDEWKDNMTKQTISFLEGETDDSNYKQLRKQAINAFIERDKKNPPSRKEIRDYGKQLDITRQNNLDVRKNIMNQYTQNAIDVNNEYYNMKNEHQEAMEKIVEDVQKERQQLIDAYTAEVKNKISGFLKEEDQIHLQEKLAKQQNAKVEQMIKEKKEELNEQAKGISELQGYSSCSANTKSNDELRQEAEEELKRQQAENEEAQAQDKPLPNPPQSSPLTTGSGFRNKSKKNSIAHQVYLLNQRYIKSF